MGNDSSRVLGVESYNHRANASRYKGAIEGLPCIDVTFKGLGEYIKRGLRYMVFSHQTDARKSCPWKELWFLLYS